MNSWATLAGTVGPGVGVEMGVGVGVRVCVGVKEGVTVAEGVGVVVSVGVGVAACVKVTLFTATSATGVGVAAPVQAPERRTMREKMGKRRNRECKIGIR